MKRYLPVAGAYALCRYLYNSWIDAFACRYEHYIGLYSSTARTNRSAGTIAAVASGFYSQVSKKISTENYLRIFSPNIMKLAVHEFRETASWLDGGTRGEVDRDKKKTLKVFVLFLEAKIQNLMY